MGYLVLIEKKLKMYFPTVERDKFGNNTESKDVSVERGSNLGPLVLELRTFTNIPQRSHMQYDGLLGSVTPYQNIHVRGGSSEVSAV